MPTAIIRPDGIGDSDDWSLQAGASKPAAVDPGDPVSHDDGTSWIGEITSGDTQEFTATSMPGGATGVRQVRGLLRGRPNEATEKNALYRLKLNGSYNTGETVTFPASSDWTTYGPFEMDRPNGGSWTLADLADTSFQLSIRRQEASAQPLGITSLWLEVDYDAGDAPLDGFREVGGRRIRILQYTPGVTSVVVPLRHLKHDLFDAIGLAHDSIARPEELLDDLESHGLVTNWRRRFSAILGVSLDMNGGGSLSLDLLNMEPAICTLFDTLSMPIAVTPDPTISESGLKRFGVAAWNAGALRTETRITPGFIVSAEEPKGTVQLVRIQDGVAKMNHLGMLAEDTFDNEVDNSCFMDGLTGWTSNLGTGGTIAIDSSERALFKDAEDGQQVVKITKGSAGDVELTRADVTSSTGDRRVYFWVRDDDTSPVVEWFYQFSDGNYWDDAGETTSATKVWNSFTLALTGQPWERIVSKRMTSVPSGNATIGIGLQESTGLENDAFFVGQIQAVESGAIVSDAITDNDGNQIGGGADTITDEMDNGGTRDEQVVHPDRGTVRFILRAYQDSDGITEGTVNRHQLWGARWNADANRDECTIEKVSGQVRISFRRFLGAGGDALAFRNITLTEGAEYEVACRWTSPSDGELGLAARTLSVFVDGVKGTDAEASDVHSSATQATQFYYGSPISNINRAANYIRHLEAVQRALPDSEILGRR